MKTNNTEAYQNHVKRLKANGVPVSMYEAACCGSILESQTNTTRRDWDTLSDCPYCGATYIKITLADSKGVLAHPIGITREEVEGALATLLAERDGNRPD